MPVPRIRDAARGAGTVSGAGEGRPSPCRSGAERKSGGIVLLTAGGLAANRIRAVAFFKNGSSFPEIRAERRVAVGRRSALLPEGKGAFSEAALTVHLFRPCRKGAVLHTGPAQAAGCPCLSGGEA